MFDLSSLPISNSFRPETELKVMKRRRRGLNDNKTSNMVACDASNTESTPLQSSSKVRRMMRQPCAVFHSRATLTMVLLMTAIAALSTYTLVDGYICFNNNGIVVGGGSSKGTTRKPFLLPLTSSLSSSTVLKVSSLSRAVESSSNKPTRRRRKQGHNNKNKVLLLKRQQQPKLKGHEQQPPSNKEHHQQMAATLLDDHIPIILEEDIDSARIVVNADNSSKIEAVVVPATPSSTNGKAVPLRNDTLGESSILYKQQIEAQIRAIHELKAAAEAAVADVQELATASSKDSSASRSSSANTASQLLEAKEKFLQRVKMTSKIAPKRRKALRRVSRISATKSSRNKKDADAKDDATQINNVAQPILVSKVEPVKQARTHTLAQTSSTETEEVVSSKKEKVVTPSKKSSTMEGLKGGSKERILSSKGAKERQMSLYGTMGNVPDSLKDFVTKVHKIQRLTPKEERMLGYQTQTAIKLLQHKDYLTTKLGRKPTRDEWLKECKLSRTNEFDDIKTEKDLILKVKEGLKAKDKLVTSNLRMVQRVVNLYIRNGLGSEYSAADLMSEGTMALIRAAEKYDASKGFRFSTYAMYWIRSAVKRSQMSQSRLINIPQRLVDTHKKILPVVEQLKQKIGRPPTAKEVAEFFQDAEGDGSKVTESVVNRCWKAMDQRIYSLDAEITNRLKPNDESGKGSNNAGSLSLSSSASSKARGGSNDKTLYHIVDGSRGDISEQERMEYTCWRDDLIKSMRRYLSGDEVDLLLLRYGLVDPKLLPKGFDHGLPLTIREVSILVGLKPDKVRRLLNNALRTLKTLMAHEWDPYYYQTEQYKRRQKEEKQRKQLVDESLERQRFLEEQRNALLSSIAREEQSRQQMLLEGTPGLP